MERGGGGEERGGGRKGEGEERRGGDLKDKLYHSTGEKQCQEQ